MTFIPAKQSNFVRVKSIEDLFSRNINDYFSRLDRDLQNLFQFVQPSIWFGSGEDGEILEYDSEIGSIKFVPDIGGWNISGDRLWAGTSGTYIALMPGTGIWLGDEAFLSAPFSVDPAGVLTAHSGEVAGWQLSETRLWKGSDLDNDYISLNPTVGIHMGAEDFDDAEFSVTKTGILKAVSGTIGGWSLSNDNLTSGSGANKIALDTLNGIWLGAETQGAAPFAVDRNGYMRATLTQLTAPIIQTNASPGTDRVVINNEGILGYDDVFGVTFKIPTDGSPPVFSSGQIQNATIINTTIISNDFKTSSELPRIEIGDSGLLYRENSGAAIYGTDTYGAPTIYGPEEHGFVGNSSKPFVSLEIERDYADFHYYDRSSNPSGVTARVGDTICVNGGLRLCTIGGDPGTWEYISHSDGTTGGSGSAGSGKQYVELEINGTIYKLLHDGTV